MSSMWKLKFKYSANASNSWHELQEKFPNGHVTKISSAVYHAVTKMDADDLKDGRLAIPGYRIVSIPGYPQGSYFCCYDNTHVSAVGLIFRVKMRQNLFVVEEIYEGNEAPPPVAAAYAA